ncbi:MAG: ATP-dependent 6-phosphofructokinase [Ignavibacteriales bacterium]|jgi:ATP-dependent phosphofructokinase / diphosphate-dependent phosphofructokinase|nr:ATP-dependent 6-phosphofructokinase [Ignavibacteriales bacterium]MBK7978807.1 ATP-dependent 6-phosphofructokinase [Ignavibacteriota bacterium]
MAKVKQIKRIALLTGGGDCPGLNAVIRGVAKPAHDHGLTVLGIQDGFEGLVNGKACELYNKDVSGILAQGGSILGSSNKGDPFHWPEIYDGQVKIVDRSDMALKHYEAWDLDALIAIGGDGTMHISKKLSDMGMNIVGVPKTIDNDLEATDQTFGHDSAVYVVSEALDRLHTTASTHHRVMVLEAMGRYAGWIALNGGLAGGADIILIPEIPFSWDAIFEKVTQRHMQGKRFSLICVAEGAKPIDGELIVKAKDIKRTDPIQLGGIAEYVAKKIEDTTGIETRYTVLGHLQRGGSPTPYDRILSTKFGTYAIEHVIKQKFGRMVALKGNEIVSVKIEDAISRQKLVTKNHQSVVTAKAIGVSFGELE